MPAKQKLIRVSSRFLGPFRWVLYVAYVVMFSGIAVASFRHSTFFGLSQSMVYGYFLFALMRATSKLERVSFDDQFLYVYRKELDMVIPLENIESVEITSLGGRYKVNLYNPEQLGKEFYFKTSLLYPLNYRSMDERVNQLRRNIDKAKSSVQDFPRNALHS
jgi:hypothetical protein